MCNDVTEYCCISAHASGQHIDVFVDVLKFAGFLHSYIAFATAGLFFFAGMVDEQR